MTTDDAETATAALRDLLAETEATRRHGISLDGYRSPATRAECYAVADAMLDLFTADWYYGVQQSANNPEIVYHCDDPASARRWKRTVNWRGPTVRQLVVRLTDQSWVVPVPEEADRG